MDFSRVRLAAFDMDGTLLNGDSQMTEATKEACRLLQQAGWRLVLATGRTYASAMMPIDRFPFDGYVCSNGAIVLKADGTVVQSTPLPAEMMLEAIAKLRQQPLYYEVHDAASNRWMVKEDRERIEALLEDDTSVEGLSMRRFSFYSLAKVVELEELLTRIRSRESQIVKLFVWHRDPAVLDWVREQLAPWEQQAEVTSSAETNVEVIAKGVSKWEGLQVFLREWNLEADQVMAFGDADNDVEILSKAGHPVAMANARPEIKALAKYVAGHHAEDGVARFIRERILQIS